MKQQMGSILTLKPANADISVFFIKHVKHILLMRRYMMASTLTVYQLH